MRFNRYLPVLVAIVSITATLILWQRLESWERLNLKNEVKAKTAGFRDDLKNGIVSHTDALNRMAKRWERKITVSQADWVYDAKLYVEDYGSFENIEWVGTDQLIHWIVPVEGNEGKVGLDFSKTPVRSEALQRARETHKLVFSKALDLSMGKKGFFAALPLYRDGALTGYIVAVFKSQEMIEGILSVMKHLEFENYVVSVYDGDGLIYASNKGVLFDNNYTEEAETDVYGTTWRIRVSPSLEYLSETHSALPHTALILGFIWSAVLTSAVYFAQTARLKGKDLEASNLRLKHEVAERKEAEDKVVRLNSLYSVLSMINEAIVRVREPEPLFRQTCKICVEEGRFLMAWISIADPETLLLRPVAQWGADDGYLDRVRVSMADIPEGRGPTGRAMREGRHFICNDIATDPNVVVWRDEALKRGYRSSAAFPLRSGDSVVGALSLYAPEPNFFNESQISLLNALSGDISFAIESAEAEKKRQLAEEALKESEALLNKAQHIAHLGSWDWDIVSNTLVWSDEIYEIFGIKRDRFGATYEAFMNSVHPEDRKSVTDAVNAAIYEKKPYLIDHRIVLPDGTVRTVQEQGDVNRNAAGEAVRMVGVVQDITERKMAEEELQEYREHLEELVEIRTAELSEVNTKLRWEISVRKTAEESVTKLAKDLEKRAIELERANKELEAFTYSASHDLQEPLRIVSGYMQLLSRRYKGKLDTDADEFIDYAVDGATRMQRLISDLLTYSRVGRIKELKTINTEEAVKGALADLKVSIEESGAVVTYGNLPTITANTQLGQVFSNLIGNAIKYRGKEKPRVDISAERADESWRFSVSDNGIGIDPRYFDRIFEIFQRLHGKSEYQGTGIGLSICKKVVENHGGTIWVESRLGEGSTFYFTIPDRKEVQNVQQNEK